MPQWLTDDEQRAWRGLVQMTSRLDARLNRELRQSSGLSLADYDVLVLLTEAPDGRLRMFQLIDDLHWEQSRLSHHIARMQRRGLVGREECTTDKRGAFVVLTDVGRETVERAARATWTSSSARCSTGCRRSRSPCSRRLSGGSSPGWPDRSPRSEARSQRPPGSASTA